MKKVFNRNGTVASVYIHRLKVLKLLVPIWSTFNLCKGALHHKYHKRKGFKGHRKSILFFHLCMLFGTGPVSFIVYVT